MKKLIFTLFLFFISLTCINAKTIEVKFSDCVDGDTAKFIYKEEIITARFLAIDTPETVHPTKEIEAFGKEASEYTCKKIKNAKKIELEYDDESDKLDKYNRHLVWVFVDGELLQKKLVSKGWASITYLYGDYKYTNELEIVEQEAEDKNLGIWSINENKESTVEENENTEEITNNTNDKKEKKDLKEIIILIGAVVILCVFSSKARKKVNKKLKKEIKKRLK